MGNKARANVLFRDAKFECCSLCVNAVGRAYICAKMLCCYAQGELTINFGAGYYYASGPC